MSDDQRNDDEQQQLAELREIEELIEGVQRGDQRAIVTTLLRYGSSRGYGLREDETVDQVLKECGLDN